MFTKIASKIKQKKNYEKLSLEIGHKQPKTFHIFTIFVESLPK